jgi:hypothetical protein
MVKSKLIKPEGEVIEVETIQRKPTALSYTAAKKLMKKEMTEKQKEHVNKLVEANRAKWEARKKEKEDLIKAEVEKELAEKKEKKKAGEIEEVIVLPKRVYKNVVKKKVIKQRAPVYDEELEETSEDETSEEELPEQIPVKQKPHKVIRQMEKKAEALQKVNQALAQAQNPANRYSTLIRF